MRAKYSDINSSVKDGFNVSLKVIIKTYSPFYSSVHATTYNQLIFINLFILKSLFSISVKKNQFDCRNITIYICANTFN